MSFLRISLAVLVFATTISLGSASAASCTNATLTGVYGYQLGASVGQFTADGKGNITAGAQMASDNGTILSQTYTGTYSVAKNCTGNITVNITGGGTGHVFFVIDEMKKGAQLIDTDAGGTADGVSLARGAVTCGSNAKKRTFAALLSGKIPNVGPIAYVSQVSLDGKGGVSGSGTFIVNGTVFSGTFGGSYTENPDCTGTMQIVPTGSFPTTNFYTVVVNGGKEILLLETDTGTVVAGDMQQ